MVQQREVLDVVVDEKPASRKVEGSVYAMNRPVMVLADQHHVGQRIIAPSAEPAHMMPLLPYDSNSGAK